MNAGVYNDLLANVTMSLAEAMEKGYIRADALDATQDSLSVDMTTRTSPSMTNTMKQTFSIRSVIDSVTGEIGRAHV